MSVGEVWRAEDVGIVRGSAPSLERPLDGGGAAWASSGVSVEEASGRTRAPVGLGSHGVRGELPDVAESAQSYARDFGAIGVGGAEPSNEELNGAA